MLGTHHIFVDAARAASSCCFINASLVTAVFLCHFFIKSSPFRFILYLKNFQLIKLVSRYVLILLAVKLNPLHPAVILTPPHPAVKGGPTT